MDHNIFEQKCTTLYNKLTNQNEFEPKCFVPTKEILELTWQEYNELSLFSNEDTSQDLLDLLHASKVLLQNYEKNPFYGYFQFHNYFMSIVNTPKRHPLVRQTVILNRLQHFRMNSLTLLKRAKETLTEEARHALAEDLRNEQALISQEVPKLIGYFPTFNTDSIRAIADAFFAHHRLLEHIIKELAK